MQLCGPLGIRTLWQAWSAMVNIFAIINRKIETSTPSSSSCSTTRIRHTSEALASADYVLIYHGLYCLPGPCEVEVSLKYRCSSHKSWDIAPRSTSEM